MVTLVITLKRVCSILHFTYLSSEIDLLSEKFLDGFATQGHSGRSKARWVTGYVVQYTIDGFSWDVISTEERERVSIVIWQCNEYVTIEPIAIEAIAK